MIIMDRSDRTITTSHPAVGMLSSSDKRDDTHWTNVEFVRCYQVIRKRRRHDVDNNKSVEAVGLVYKEICGDHGRILWFRDTSDAKDIGITEASPICEPFKEDLTPDTEKLALLAKILNEIVQNFTEGIPPSFVLPRAIESSTPKKDDVVTTIKDGQLEVTTATIQKEYSEDFARRNDPGTAVPKSISTLGVPYPIPDREGTSYLVVEEANDHKTGVEDHGRRADEAEQKHPTRVESVTQGHSYVNNDIMEHEEDYPEDRKDYVRYKALHHLRKKRDEEDGNGNQEKKSSDEDDYEWLESMVGIVKKMIKHQV
ncbi:hypothetical protein ANCCAN_04476 [Ancylostoma caninum]|uniref:Uncharacterized protein n=1 Tax=Ancylostoma caninum TaxID=29170 RepID=A0A368GYE4_ANCCA|nr:hypothetical protein ANCCAN_04476 [Ancylostoma caninum]